MAVEYLCGHTIPETEKAYWQVRVEELRKLYKKYEKHLSVSGIFPRILVGAPADLYSRIEKIFFKTPDFRGKLGIQALKSGMWSAKLYSLVISQA